MKAIKQLINRIDAALDAFWIGKVKVGYHRAMANHYRQSANRAQADGVYLRLKVPTDRLNYLRHQEKRHMLDAKLAKGGL